MGILNKLKLGFAKNTLLFADAYEKRFAPWIVENYKSVLSDLGIRFLYLADFKMPSGYELIVSGAMREFYAFKEENLSILEELKVNKLIVCSDEAYWTFKKYYPELDVVHVLDLIEEQRSKLLASYKEELVYYDTHYLKNQGIVSQPRRILQVLGCKVEEYPQVRKGISTGCEALLDLNSPQIAKKIAQEFLSQIKNKTVVISSARAYMHLSKFASSYHVKIKELSEFLVEI